jgi:hypothetical protein
MIDCNLFKFTFFMDAEKSFFFLYLGSLLHFGHMLFLA